jgi:hypothetical protein
VTDIRDAQAAQRVIGPDCRHDGHAGLHLPLVFGRHGLRDLERNILGFCGIRPIRASLIGMVDAGGAARRAKWLDRLSALGRRGR